MKERYFDNASTTKTREEVVNEMMKYFGDEYGNPSSFHYKGLWAKDAIDKSRKKVAEILNCNSDEIVFTGGGSESINLALKGIAFANKERGNHIITTKIEHPAVLNACAWLANNGFEVSYVAPDSEGLINVEDVKKAIRKETILISVMYANNEIGTIEPIAQIGKIAKEKKIYFHSDGCQAGGTLDVEVSNLNVDLFTLNGSKIYGSKGVGILYVKRGVKIDPIIHGGGQEKGLRGGTENVPAIVGFVKALELAQKEKDKENARLSELRDYLIKELLKIKLTRLNGHATKRLANNANITFMNIEGESILLYLNEKGIFASTGSACSSHSLEPSHVLLAIGLPPEMAHGSIRFTLGKETSMEDVKFVIKTMPEIVEKLRKISPISIENSVGGKK